MKIIQKVIYAGFAAMAFVSASLPVFSVAAPLYDRAPLYGPDFEWYAQVGRPTPMIDVYEVVPAPRAGAIWSPGRWEWNGYRHRWVAGHWIKDDYAEQLALYNARPESRVVLVPVPTGTLRR